VLEPVRFRFNFTETREFNRYRPSDKETWDPVIEYLFQFQHSDPCGVSIAEVWSAESPNHGESAAINEKSLLERPGGICMFSLP
jgi:hypothetical protein